MTAKGTAARMVAKYGAAKAEELALWMGLSASLAYNFGPSKGRMRETEYYLVRWTFWEAVARRARREGSTNG